MRTPRDRNCIVKKTRFFGGISFLTIVTTDLYSLFSARAPPFCSANAYGNLSDSTPLPNAYKRNGTRRQTAPTRKNDYRLQHLTENMRCLFSWCGNFAPPKKHPHKLSPAPFSGDSVLTKDSATPSYSSSAGIPYTRRFGVVSRFPPPFFFMVKPSSLSHARFFRLCCPFDISPAPLSFFIRNVFPCPFRASEDLSLFGSLSLFTTKKSPDFLCHKNPGLFRLFHFKHKEKSAVTFRRKHDTFRNDGCNSKLTAGSSTTSPPRREAECRQSPTRSHDLLLPFYPRFSYPFPFRPAHQAFPFLFFLFS